MAGISDAADGIKAIKMSVVLRKHGTISATPPFDFEKSLDYLRQSPPPALNQTVSDTWFLKAFRLDGQTVLCRVSSEAGTGEPLVDYELYSDREVSDGLESAWVDRLSAFLGLRDDLSGFYALAEADPLFAPILQELFGYHPVRFPTPFEAAAWAILSQRNRMTTARNMHQKLVCRFGHSAELDGTVCWAFPEPHELAGLSEGDLAVVARSLRRGEYLIEAARAFTMASPEFLHEAPSSELEDWLRGINGIGPWSAGFILLRGLGCSESFPLMDLRIVEAASRVYGRGLTLAASDLKRIAKGYGPWQGHWAQYLRLAA